MRSANLTAVILNLCRLDPNRTADSLGTAKFYQFTVFDLENWLYKKLQGSAQRSIQLPD